MTCAIACAILNGNEQAVDDSRDVALAWTIQGLGGGWADTEIDSRDVAIEALILAPANVHVSLDFSMGDPP